MKTEQTYKTVDWQAAPCKSFQWHWLVMFISIVCLALGCHKHEDATITKSSGSSPPVENLPSPAPAASQTPTVVQTVAPADNGNIDATLATLTRELRRAMIGRHLSGDFAEFVAVRNSQVPPPPSGKKYAISKQWKVILEDVK